MSAPSPQSPSVSAYIPCYNNATTVAQAIQGMRQQIHPVDELFVVDDGSTDNSVEVIERLGVNLVRMEKNQGRGAVRARAMEKAQNEFVLCGDATNALSPDFLLKGLKWFADEKIVGVFGRHHDRLARTTVDRWRARHLFKQYIFHKVLQEACFSTYGAIVRRSSAMAVGNYNAALRHGEDFDLGARLLTIGNVIYDPEMEVQPVIRNTLFEVMERYTRWNRASIKTYSITDFIDSHKVAWKILMPRDLEDRDWKAAVISAMVPYFSVALADKRSLTLPPRIPMDAPRELEGRP